MICALGDLPGGLGRFLPCRIGANHCRLQSIGWERCGHGLTSRPLETSDAGFFMIYFFFLDTVLGLDSRLLMVLLGCGIVPQIFLRLPHCGGVAALVAAASAQPLVAGLRDSGEISSFWKN